MAKDLRQFLDTVRRAGPEFYVDVRKPLDPRYQVAVLQHKLVKLGRFPVIYCHQIEGSRLPLVTNLMGCYELLGVALGVMPERFRRAGRGEILREFQKRRSSPVPVREVPASQAPVREVVFQGKDVDLGVLPITLHAEGNAGKYVTVGMSVTREPDSGAPNVGVYRQEVKAGDRLAVMTNPRHDGSRIARRYAELDRPMEIVTVIGHHPAVEIAAAVTSPYGKNELELAGGLLGEPLEVTRGLTVDLPVPAWAEIAIEGVIDPKHIEREGPFSEGAGFYHPGKPCYVMEIRAITMRKDAIYQDLHPTTQEHGLASTLGKELAMLEAIRKVVPSVRAVHLGPEGHTGKLTVYVSIEKRSDEDVKLAGMAALAGARKVAVVVDDDIDVYDQAEVLWAIETRIAHNTTFTMEVPGANEEIAGSRVEAGTNTKIVIDATKALGLAGPRRVTFSREIWDSVDLGECLK